MPSVQRLGLVASFVLASALARGEEHDYLFYDLGDLGCTDPYANEAYDITDTGIIAGYGIESGCPLQNHAILWENGRMTDLNGTYSGVVKSARGISEANVIVANALPEGEPWPKDVVIRDDLFIPVTLPDGCTLHGSANDINAHGTLVAGECITDQAFRLPILYSTEDGEAISLGLLLGCLAEDFWGCANGVNNNGVVTGTIWCNDDPARGFTWVDGQITEIPNLVGGKGVTGAAINNNNLIVGEAQVADGDYLAMSYNLNTGEMTVLGSGRADAVNDRGSAVGRIILNLSAVHGILFEDGIELDLSVFFPGELEGNNRPHAINNYGWIVGHAEAEESDDWHSWLLVPVYDKGDYDGDTDVDHQDFQHFQRCFAADPYTNGMLHVGCSVFDFDDDVDLDLDDYAAFQSAFTGPTAPNNNPNGPG